ncbi:hypothetical protein NQ318_013939 [Aromia moschata]|uniref:C3H1-type domain-containing protein n=1 Tax=Aromia moschata TaxID=1265417 RepID=A0AAV8ZBI6_9CUCU|nr:hypothetical protein NQ318_013939 [Aromia moschata]
MIDIGRILLSYSSTIGDNHEDPIGGSLASRTPSSHLETSPSRPDVRDISRSNELVENWIRSVPSSHQPPDDIAVMADAQPETEPAPHEGITFLPPLMQKGYPRIYFKDVPPIFLGLCYYYYFTGNCARIGNCDLYHNVPKEKYTAKFSKSTPDILRKGYSPHSHHLFKEIYPCFLAAFGLLNMHNELMKSIKDLLGLAHIDATEAVDSVVQSFVQSGLPFLDVIERISFNVGFLQHPQLADILLDLITRKQNVSENWEVIQRIAKARGRISPDIARRILNRVTASYPVNKNLCLEIYNVIIKKNMTDVARISADVLAPFRAIEGFRDLEEVPSPICPGTVSPSRIPLVPLAAGFSDKEMMVAHIDRNLTRERERFEREVAGNTVTTKAAAVPVPAASPERSYIVQTYDYNHLTKLAGHYDGCFGSETDADDRYFMPSSRQEPFAVHKSSPFRSSDSDKHSAGGSCSSYNGITSPKSSLHFEPPELSEYVPDTVPCVDKR